MELILWRHAEAEAGEPDEGRVLTPKGHKQAWKVADWLDRNLPGSCRILVSPAKRTIQTAEALGRKFKIHPDLAPEATPEQILAAAHWPVSRESVARKQTEAIVRGGRRGARSGLRHRSLQ